ncbi:MAG: glycosyltransferase family 39 protein [Chthoniobacteraceae bacterium]|jgi:hypothetical protein
MQSSVSPGQTAARPAWLLPIALLLALIVGAYHVASGSSRSELGSHPDEAAHFVTGLMVRDYLASGFHQSPLRYADDYYLHYPKIGLGVWPPFFYLVQAAWMFAFDVGIQPILWLMSALCVGLGILLAWALLKDFGWPAAVAGPVLLVSLPLVQQYSNMVMAEMLSALLMFGAALSFARFIEGGSMRAAVGFGILAGLAIMTKGTGLALVLVPPAAILLTGRFVLLRDGRLWMAALIVLAIAGPWTWHFRNIGRGGWEEPSPSLHFTGEAILFYGRQLVVAAGLILAAPALIGAGTLFERDGRKSGMTVTCVSMVLAVWAFQAVTPVGLEARHLTPAMPALIYLAMAGARRLAGAWPRVGAAIIYGVLLLLFFATPLAVPLRTAPGYGSLGDVIGLSPFRIAKKEWHGFQEIAEQALAAHCNHLLVASDARGEGMFIADVAIRDPHRPGYTVDRASKMLASSTWSGGTYQSFYSAPAQLAAVLAKSGVEAVVIDLTPAKIQPHEQLLGQALADPNCGYQLAHLATVTRDGREYPGGAALYIRKDARGGRASQGPSFQ